MDTVAKPVPSNAVTILHLPSWITLRPDEATENVAFLSGAALATLDGVLRDPRAAWPGPLLRDRLALDAAVACLKLGGRRETASLIRDAVCLARDGDAPGPAGEMFLAWRRLARVNLAAGQWKDRVREMLPATVAEAMSDFDGPPRAPVARASQILSDTLRQFPREEASALMLADLALARAVGWDRVVPMLATQMGGRDIRAIAQGQDDALPHVHSAVLTACDGVIRTSADLGRRVAKLRMIAPKLRAKGSDEALALFLSHDAVSPSGMLSPMIDGTAVAMTDRAARRLCDRLVDLGVIRELTGRATSRLYGV